MKSDSLMTEVRPIPLTEIPPRARTWTLYTESVTQLAHQLTSKTIRVRHLRQQISANPAWLSAQFHNGKTFTRSIELFAGRQRILIATTFALPQSDVVVKLEELGNKPLATLLFQNPANLAAPKDYLRAQQWYGRSVEWKVTGCKHSLLLAELFDPTFVSRYAPPT